MESVVTIIQTLGFPIACVVACGVFIYKMWDWFKNSSKEREDKLLENNNKNAEALVKVADTIEESNKINRELSETNRTLVDKVEEKLATIGNNVDKLIEREESR